MESGHLLDPRSIPKRVWQDHGLINPNPAEGGITGARHVVTEDGEEYVAKADGWGADSVPGTHVLLQEWMCARLAQAIGVPIPEYSLLDLNGSPCFGSRKLPLYASRFAHPLLGRVVNPDAVYSIAVFDAWILNRDRHPGNLVVAIQSQSPVLVAIDHSHCPLYGVEQFGALQDNRDIPAIAAIQRYLRPAITDREHLARCVHRVQTLGDDEIRSLIKPPDGICFSTEEQSQVAEYLLYRRDSMSNLFNSSRDDFPAIREQPL